MHRSALQAGELVLDLATGTGTIALAAARQVGPQGQVVGVDLSAQKLAEAERKAAVRCLADRVTFHLADAETFPSELRFDHAFCCAALVWMGDVKRDILIEAGFEAIDILEEQDVLEVPLSQMLGSGPQRDFPFPGQEPDPLQDVGQEEWAAIHAETCARLEQRAMDGVIRENRTSLFARAREPGQQTSEEGHRTCGSGEGLNEVLSLSTIVPQPSVDEVANIVRQSSTTRLLSAWLSTRKRPQVAIGSGLSDRSGQSRRWPP